MHTFPATDTIILLEGNSPFFINSPITLNKSVTLIGSGGSPTIKCSLSAFYKRFLMVILIHIAKIGGPMEIVTRKVLSLTN